MNTKLALVECLDHSDDVSQIYDSTKTTIVWSELLVLLSALKQNLKKGEKFKCLKN